MKAMVLAAGLGTRLRPLTYEITKPMVPVIDRPVMEHILDLLSRHGFDQVIANLHYFPDSIKEYFGDRITYRVEEELLGTAGGVRACADFFAGEALPGHLRRRADRHRPRAPWRHATGRPAESPTLAVKKVSDTREYGVVLHDREGRITGFQEKPTPDEALSDLGNCGIYVFSPEIFDYFPERPFADWAQDVFPALLENDVPFHIHEVREYWNDVGSLTELRQGTFDALCGELKLEMEGTEVSSGVTGLRWHHATRGHDRRRTRMDRLGCQDRRRGSTDRPNRPGRQCKRRRPFPAPLEHRLPGYRDRRRLDSDRRDLRS